MTIGEIWAYRARAVDPLVPAEVLKEGTQRPARILVRFVGNEFEGREEWVPPARLKVRWESVDAWLAEELRWEATRDASWRDWDDPELNAVDTVFDQCLDRDVAWRGYNKNNGLLFIKDVARLADDLEFDPSELTGDPLSFTDVNGAVVAPWTVTVAVAQRLATQHAAKLLAHVEHEEANDRREALYGHYSPGRGRDREMYIEPETCAETAEENERVYRIVRQWCGAEAHAAYDELKALRVEVRRLGQLVERAVTALQNAGAPTIAEELGQDLGVPIETLRSQRRRGQ